MTTPTFAPELWCVPASIVAAISIGVAGCSSSNSITSSNEGVNVGASSAIRKLVPAAQLEASAAGQYSSILQKALKTGALSPDSDPQVQRLRRIAKKITPNSQKFNLRAGGWKWEVNLIRSDKINAFCMPGGKILFYSGILEKLKLTDDEVGVIMGHEIAHALREHAREQIAKSQLTNVGTGIATAVLGDESSNLLKNGAQLLTLKYSRDDESDADLVGLELAARAGYDPRAGITLWQKMAAASGGAPLEFLSTHPSGQTRIANIRRNLPAVMPLYEQARGDQKQTAQTQQIKY